jgi:hypothetical protein
LFFFFLDCETSIPRVSINKRKTDWFHLLFLDSA